MNNPKCRGYIFSRPCQGNRVPQHIQNLVIRDYCEKKEYHYLLSATEYAMEHSYLILYQLLEDLNCIDGIVAYTLFQMPEKQDERLIIYDKMLCQGKTISFAVEQLSVASEVDVNRLENIRMVQDEMESCSPAINDLIKYAED